MGLGTLLLSLVAVEALELEKGSFMMNYDRQRSEGKSESCYGRIQCLTMVSLTSGRKGEQYVHRREVIFFVLGAKGVDVTCNRPKAFIDSL